MSKEMNDWRYRCPRGHNSYESANTGHYRCDRCRINGDDHYFTELVDMKTQSLPDNPQMYAEPP